MSIAQEQPDQVVRQSLGEVVYERLIDAILSGRLVGGDELSEVALAEQFGVSRTPVRDALNRLSLDGLVEYGRNRRATVRTITREIVIEIYQVRQLLEAGAARLAAGRLDAGDLATLDDMARKSKPSADHPWQEDALRFDAALHATIAAKCGNHRLAQEIPRFSNFVPILQRLAGKRDDRLESAYEQHLRIIAAIRAGRADDAFREMSNHIGAALTVILADVFPEK